ncbi:hypothetical protein RRG08_029688 [Elysia crispata]|uniref:Uncharacterized protein n=1 Tax=Elysia crispata TaxID=231223 RepID=A0AAE0Y6H9_9GAST|nr:hypothetical protein RRG08_029688 [Elysia crispata]
MSWSDFITHVASTTSKVERVLVYDDQGNPLAVTNGVETSQAEGQALTNCLLDPTLLLTKLDIDGDCFWCIQGVDNNMVGRGVKDDSLVIAAVQEGNNSVAFIGRSAGKGSFIFELQDCLTLRAQGRLLPQLQKQQKEKEQQLLVTVDANNDGAAFAVNQALVDIELP